MKKEENQKINVSTILVASCTMISRLVGFVRIGVISAFFGTTAYADILNLVLSVPNNLRKLFSEGALSNAFMPIFAKTLHKLESGDVYATQNSRLFFSNLLFWIALPVLLLVIAGSIFSRTIVNLLFHFTSQEHEILAAQLFSIVIFFLFFMMLSAIAAGVHQTHKRFLLPAISPLILSLVVIFVIVFFATSIGIVSASIGYTLGGILQAVVLLVTLRPLGYSIRFSATYSKFIKQTFMHILPIILTLIAPVVGQQVSFYFASTLQEGSSSAFAYAIVFWQLPIGVVVNSIISVGFSYIITSLQDNSSSPATYERKSIYNLLVVSFPIAIAMFFFSHAGVAIALQRGAFTAESVHTTAYILKWFALAFIPFSLYQAGQKFLYARQKIFAVFLFSTIFTVLDIVFSFFLIRTSLQIGGLSLAYALTLVIVCPLLFYYYFVLTKYALINFTRIKKIFLANIPLALVAFLISYITRDIWYKGSTMSNIVSFIGILIILLVVCIIGYKSVGISIISMIRTYRSKKK